ncbi:MAG: hypothetical protein WCT16_00680 [Candidatus Buchananbacteria bacterium]
MLELSPFCTSPAGKKAKLFALVYQGSTPEPRKIDLGNCPLTSYPGNSDPFVAMSPDSLMVKDLIYAIHRANEKMAFSMSGISLGDDPMELLLGIRRGQFERLFTIAMEHDPLGRILSENGFLTGACVAFDIITLCEISALKVPPISVIVSSGTKEWSSIAKTLDQFQPKFKEFGVRIIDERDMIKSPKKLLK